MKTLNKFLEEVKPEPPEEDNQIKSKERRQQMIKKQVLLKKMQAVRSGAGADIVASHTPEGEMVEEKEADKKKGRHPRDQKELERAQAYIKKNPKFGIKEGDVHSGQGEKIQKRTKKWMDKKGQKGAPGLDAMKARTAEHKAKRGVKEDVVDEGVGRAAIGAAIGSVAGPVGAAAGAAIGASLGKKKVTSGAGGKKKPKNFFKAEPKVTTSEDKAFNYVVAKLKKQYGDGVLTKGDKMPQPSAAQKKKNAAIRAKRAKEDHRDETEKATSGRYNDRSRSD